MTKTDRILEIHEKRLLAYVPVEVLIALVSVMCRGMDTAESAYSCHPCYTTTKAEMLLNTALR